MLPYVKLFGDLSATIDLLSDAEAGRLPNSYNQRRTVQLNYEVLRKMYFARKDHKLDEWHTLCAWMLALPYFREICGGEGGKD